jgi:aryl-alcohol dehydrogenase-like predicted oxidoreductase
MLSESTMDLRPLGSTGLRIAPLVFGGNVFGWTADETTSFSLLDAFVDAGFNAIDTADVYSRWVPGHTGGESETILGRWLKARPGMRARVLLLTKCGHDMGEGRKGLSARWIEQAAEASLGRLQTDVIDLYQAHLPDASTPHEETLRAFERLIKAGKVRAIGCSNFDASQLADALAAARAHRLPRYQTLQPEYNLVARGKFEGALRDLAIAEALGVITYYSLASGFLTGKYRSRDDLGQSPRGRGMTKYLDDPRAVRTLDALETVARRHGAKPGEVALAWLMARPGVTAPIASATRVEQVASFARAAALRLDDEDRRALDSASAPAAADAT